MKRKQLHTLRYRKAKKKTQEKKQNVAMFDVCHKRKVHTSSEQEHTSFGYFNGHYELLMIIEFHW